MSGEHGEFGYHELERAALGFVLEDETWPVFLAWCRSQHVTAASHAWLEAGPNLAEIRREFLRHSPNAELRALGGAS